jgi:hypothetical protein
MTAFKKFDPHAFLERERLAPDSTITLATLASLAGQPLENEIRTTPNKMSQWDNGTVTAKSIEIRGDDHTVEHGLDKNQSLTPTPAKVAKVAKDPDFSTFDSLPAAFGAWSASARPSYQTTAGGRQSRMVGSS